MAKGNQIIVSPHPRGIFDEGVIAAGESPKPGTIVQIQDSAGIGNDGKFTFEIYNADADGGRPKGPLYILRESELDGTDETTAYAAGDRCFVYIPAPGEQFNMLILNIAGTADDHAFGEILIIDDTTGKLIATTGSPETECFKLLEAITDPTADTLAHVIYTGY